MATNTSNANEQMFLELINSARLDPLGDAARYISAYGTQAQSGVANINQALDFFNVSGTLLLQQYTALNPARPVAWNNKLAAAAEKHSEKMIATNTQSHQLPGEFSLPARITAQEYSFSNVAENIYAYTKDPLFGHAGFMVDWGRAQDGAVGGMQVPPGHRVSIMNPIYREVGIGVVAENTSNAVGPLVVTQDFGTRNNFSGVLILGVAYTDTTGNSSKNDNFYSVGEGEAGLRVALGGSSVVSSSSGGYTLETSATGPQTITLSGAPAGLANPVTFQTTLAAGRNIKLDVIDGDTLQTSVSGTIAGSDITKVVGLGLTGLTLTTGSGAQTLVGTKGNDTLSGGSGSDKMSGGTGNDTYVVAQSGDKVTESSGKGTDTVQSSISYTLTDNVEKLTLIGSSDRNGTGNSLKNTIQGNSGDNLLDGKGGADTVKGGGGDDTLIWSSSDVRLDGGTNSAEAGDTLRVSGSGVTLDLTDVPAGRIRNMERIDLMETGANVLTLNMEEVLALSSTSDTLQVLGNDGDTVNMEGVWVQDLGADQEIDGHTYESYTQGPLATLLVDTDITIV